jgi:hypothetical protein
MADEFEPSDRQRFETALQRFDTENSRDPNSEQTAEGISYPRELVYAQRLTDWVLRLSPGASEELRLAARCQHLCRWMVPRDSYPMTRAGYLQWREGLKKFHANKASEILRSAGYPESVIIRVQALNLKKDFPVDAEVRVLEDALCLVFLEHQFAPLSEKTSDEKIVNALQKSWKKMTPRARVLARELAFSPRQQSLLTKALATEEEKSAI